MKKILPVIVISQFFCTSLWFAGNAVIADISQQLHLNQSYLAYLTSAVQAGFICGTLIFAILSMADRFSPSRVFFFCAMIAALVNLAVSLNGINVFELMALRFLTGFFLAGIYPVGMKIAADHYDAGLGKSLGFLLGALVLGTAFPHLLKSVTFALPWQYVIFSTTILSVIGGAGIFLLVPDGLYRKPGAKLNPSGFLKNFNNKDFRSAAFGHFGHMWELYAFWVFVPTILAAYNTSNPAAQLNVPLLSFFIIASGSIACVISGLISHSIGTKKTATISLAISCCCCLASPLFFFNVSATVFIPFLFIWGMAVIADSPMFSTMVAQSVPPTLKGTSLTIVNCIGFSITIISIQLLNAFRTIENATYIYLLLAAGPILGLIALGGFIRKDK
ncbi:MAG TPA: MFS transporter [Mucilaginibacter sp.]